MTFADRRYEVDATSCVFSWRNFESYTLVRINWHQIVKIGAFADFVGVDTVDSRYAYHCRRPALLYLFTKRLYVVTSTQSVLFYFHCGHISVHLVEFTVLNAQKTVSVGIDFEISFSLLFRALVNRLFTFVEYVFFVVLTVVLRFLKLTVGRTEHDGLKFWLLIKLFAIVLGSGFLSLFFLFCSFRSEIRHNFCALFRFFGTTSTRCCGRLHFTVGDFVDQIYKFRLIKFRRCTDTDVFCERTHFKNAFCVKFIFSKSLHKKLLDDFPFRK